MSMQYGSSEARNSKRITAMSAATSNPSRTAARFDTHLFATGKVAQRVTPTTRSLEQYMLLPVAGYALMPMPPGTALKRVPGSADLFELEAPSLKFFNVEVKPIIVSRVAPTPNAVFISSQQCVIRGSPMVNQLGLNDIFALDVQVQFTWSGNTIYSKSDIKVDVAVPPMFRMLPKDLVISTGNGVMQTALNLIQQEFLKSLGKDFERWSRDDDYFAQRAKLVEKS